MPSDKKGLAGLLKKIGSLVWPELAIDTELKKEIDAGEADLVFIRALIGKRGTHALPPREVLDSIKSEMRSRTLRTIHEFLLEDSAKLDAENTRIMLEKVKEVLANSVTFNQSLLSRRAK